MSGLCGWRELFVTFDARDPTAQCGRHENGTDGSQTFDVIGNVTVPPAIFRYDSVA